MENLANLLTLRHIVAAVITYLASFVLYRLFLHPLARFPGPKLAAITRWYEGYYDIIQNGHYTFKIAELHKEYGPIIRISPYELHVNDPAFFEQLYRQDGRWHKYSWAMDAFGAKGATLFTVDHELHKSRRQPLGPFFSKAKVASRQDLIHRHLLKFCGRISKFANSGETFNLGAAATAITRDVANEFILNKSYNSLDREDFDITMLTASQGSGQIWRPSKHIPVITKIFKAIPIDWIIKNAGDDMKEFFLYLKETMQDTKNLMAAATSPISDQDKDQEYQRTIVNGILDSKLPSSEKSVERVFDDVSTVAGAGFETTASVLRLVFFHVFDNPDILKQLRTELTSINADPSEVEIKTLEQLPYLTSTLMEGLRLSPAIATRMARISTDKDLFYGNWRIPIGTPVGMTTILMHTDETLYPDPKRFNPDRWMDPESRKMVDKTFAPFSRGTRNCLGMHLAWAELYVIVATIAYRYNFKFQGATAEDFECISDQFAIGTKGRGNLNATVSIREM
ncbi:cytochrome P450 [Annulohypoxylon maeteangense]|uniref:cytochrome P450 n=1 Tax=Annulohypoxylon maeteangense TaxID=1927788 RepID=UPI002008AD12|nr:cytochrome P450 [Annulohypoxylon maeteangense]KAI0884561.1 cytochrome P450 [Annulohypoxylon maeteangense]